MRLRWTTPAAEDLYNIVRRIQQDNPDAAAKVAHTLYDGCGTLGNFPRRGRKEAGDQAPLDANLLSQAQIRSFQYPGFRLVWATATT